MRSSRPKLRTIFILVHLVILLLPLCSLFFFRLYENMLIRQTEQELISQGIMLASSYKHEIAGKLKKEQEYGTFLSGYDPKRIDETYTPVFPLLDLASVDTLPPRPEGEYTDEADPIASQAGDRLTPIIADAKLSTLSGMLILDHQGVVVAGTNHIGESFTHVPEVSVALNGEYHSVIRKRKTTHANPALSSISRGTGIRIFVAVPIIQEQYLWGVTYLSRTPQNILKHLYDEKEKVIFAGITILGATIALSILLSYTVSGPVSRLVKQVEHVRRGDQTVMQPLTSPGTAEIEHLSQSFIDLTQHLHERSHYIREFAMHISHEFKTPLTAILGAIELLEEDKGSMSEQQRKRFLNNISKDTKRLSQLVLRLLELARADNLTPEKETCELIPLLQKLQSEYTSLGLAIEYDVPRVISLSIVAEIMETILRNLADNALAAGATTVSIESNIKDGLYELTMNDNGKGISKANRDKLFTPFFTTRRDQGGTGLGLPIVRSMLEAYGGRIVLADSDSSTRFQLSLKISANL